jgi:hypothetical protein
MATYIMKCLQERFTTLRSQILAACSEGIISHFTSRAPCNDMQHK